MKLNFARKLFKLIQMEPIFTFLDIAILKEFVYLDMKNAK